MTCESTILAHVSAIIELFDAADKVHLPLWLESGWAIDARLGRITRPHEDIDIAFPEERRAEYIGLIEGLGFGAHEFLDYGFLSLRGDVLLDSEPSFLIEGECGSLRFPAGSCPMEKQGSINGRPIRCLSWEAIYVEFLGYASEVPKREWRSKDHHSFAIVQSHICSEIQEQLRRAHLRSIGRDSE